MKTNLKYGVAALALTVGMGFGALNATAQTSSSSTTNATDAATTGSQTGGTGGTGASTTSGSMTGTSDTSSGSAASSSSGSTETSTDSAAKKSDNAQSAATGATMSVDKMSFAEQAASSNMFEIESSKLAKKHAKSKQVKNFAEMMISDHTKAGKRMEQTLEKEGMKPSKSLSPKHEALLQELEAAKGADFDKAYITAQTQAHMEAVTLFKNYSENPDDKALGAFAKKTLPTLEKHLEHVQKLGSAE